MSSMLLERVGLCLHCVLPVGVAGEEEDWDLLDLPAGLPGPWFVLESDFTLDGDAGALSSDFFFSPGYNREIEKND